ncbi:MAG: YDG domain-containing protein, partial [Oscillospiraceae bacterium]
MNTKDWAVGPHKLTATFAGNHELLGASTTNEVTVTINQAEQAALSIDGVPNKVTYGDANFTLSTTGGSGTGAAVTYAVTTGTDVVSVTSAGEVTVLKAGTATITATKAGDTNYNAKTATVEIAVQSAKPTLTWGTTEQSTDYTGSPVLASVLTAPTVTLVKGETFKGTIQYAYEKAGSSTGYTDGLPTAAGEYTIKAKIAAAGNYTAADSTNTMTLTINKSTPALAINTMTGKTYDGTAVTNPTAANMTITGANYADVKFAYSKNDNMSSPLAAAPKDAGTYYVQANVVAGVNTNAASSAAVSFTITQAALTVTGGTVTQREYNGGADAAVTALTLNGLANGETLALTTDYTVGSPVYNDANAGTGKTVSGTAALVSNAKTGNYTLTGAYT